MRRVVPIAVGSLLAVVIAVPAVAGGHDPYEPPPPGTVTVPARGPGEDYKSNSAEPEPIPTEPRRLSEEEIRGIYEQIDPGDSPNVRVCVNPDGSGAVEYIYPAEPGAKAAPLPPGRELARADHINDKGRCR